LSAIRRTRWLSVTVRDQRWSDALAVVSVIAPLLLLVAALTEFRIPQAVASSITGHPHWGITASLGLADLPMAAGATTTTSRVRRSRRSRVWSARSAPDGPARPPGAGQARSR